jgi:hypothetical protein
MLMPESNREINLLRRHADSLPEAHELLCCKFQEGRVPFIESFGLAALCGSRGVRCCHVKSPSRFRRKFRSD